MVHLDRRRLAVFLAGASAFLDMYCTQALLPDLAQHFQTGSAQVGLTITASTLATAMVAPIIGGLADRLGRKGVIVCGALLLVLPTLAMAWVNDLPTMLFWRFLQGLCMPAIFTVTVAYVGEEWGASDMPSVIGFYTSGTALGGVMGRLITAVAADHVGWQGAFVVLAAVNLLAALTIAWLLPAARNFHPSRSLADSLAGFVDHFRNPTLLATCAIGCTVLFTLVATFTYATFYLAAPPFSLSTAQLGYIFVVYLLGIISAPIGGTLIGRIGRRGALVLASALSIAGLLLTLIPGLGVIIAGFALLAGGVFICQTASMSMINASARTARSAAVGLYVTSYYMGGSVGAFIPAPAWDRWGWAGCVAVIVAMILLGSAIGWYFWNPRRLSYDRGSGAAK